MLKQLIFYFREIPYEVYNFIQCRYRKVDVGSNVTLKGMILLRGRAKISIGDNTRIKSGIRYNPIGGDVRTMLICSDTGRINISENVGISNSAIVSHLSISIGNNVMIGGGVKIYDTDFHSLDFKERITGMEGIRCAPVKINEGVFVGAHSIILKGVEIGAYSVIGAGSVVTKSIPSYEVWGGNPAAFIKSIKPNEVLE